MLYAAEEKKLIFTVPINATKSKALKVAAI